MKVLLYHHRSHFRHTIKNNCMLGRIPASLHTARCIDYISGKYLNYAAGGLIRWCHSHDDMEVVSALLAPCEGYPRDALHKRLVKRNLHILFVISLFNKECSCWSTLVCRPYNVFYYFISKHTNTDRAVIEYTIQNPQLKYIHCVSHMFWDRRLSLWLSSLCWINAVIPLKWWSSDF